MELRRRNKTATRSMKSDNPVNFGQFPAPQVSFNWIAALNCRVGKEKMVLKSKQGGQI